MGGRGYPGSLAWRQLVLGQLSQCPGAKGRCWCLGRGLLQFENVSYGIEPLGYSPAFRHMLYRVSEEHMAEALPAHSPPEAGLGGLAAWEMLDKAHGDDEVSGARCHSAAGVPVL